MNVAFVLLTYGPDEPAGIERSIAALATGLRQLGHQAHVLTAGAPTSADGPEIVRLPSIRLPRPAIEDDLLAAIEAAPNIGAEIQAVLTELDADLACWVDATWGLGYLAPSPDGVGTALMVRVLRTDTYIRRALDQRPDHILTNGDFLVREGAAAGLDTRAWQVLPNGLLTTGQPPDAADRESRRRAGPVRIVARAEPHKGVAELIDACPAGLGRPVEIVLAPAGFEYWPGMQDDVVADCQRRVAALPDISLLPALPWRDVQPFLAGASCTIIASTSPETFCLVALEAMSVGTPVVSFDLGHVPTLIGPAGTVVPVSAGAAGLWRAVDDLLADPDTYRCATEAGPVRAADYTPTAVARAFLDAVAPRTTP